MSKTLYIRNVPDDVAERLAEMAANEGLSVSAFAARELSFVARSFDNAALLASLPSHDHISPEDILRTIHENRGER